MGRIKGTKAQPHWQKPGQKSKLDQVIRAAPEEILEHKVKILELLCSGVCTTLTGAAEQLGLSAWRVQRWARSDKDFGEAVDTARQVVADHIEKEFQGHANFIPKMMLLKAYRPMFKDNYRLDVSSPRLEELLKELRETDEKAVPQPKEAEKK